MRITFRTKKSHFIFITGDDADKDEAVFVQIATGEFEVAPPLPVEYEEDEDWSQGHRKPIGFNATPGFARGVG